MKSTFASVSTGILFFVVCYPMGAAAGVRVASSTESALSTPCSAPAYHQFDFWVGDWDVFDVDSPNKAAHARIDSILNGCVLRENYQGLDGRQGQSFTTYDASRNAWHQTWVTNGGELLEIDGKFEKNGIQLSGKNQHGLLVQGTWKPVNGEVRETAVRSSDNGKSWEPWFDIIFRRSASDGSASDASAVGGKTDEEIVAALDSEYQEAVKRNDAGAMDRILGDEFVLVSSSGTTYTKAQLLDEARSARTIYEHQEDSHKTVRMFGDTAIVTAYLWEKGVEDGKPFDHKLWFSDVYRHTPTGWRYVFAQSAYRPGESAQP